MATNGNQALTLSLPSLLHPPVFSCFSHMRERGGSSRDTRELGFGEGRGHGKGEKPLGLFMCGTVALQYRPFSFFKSCKNYILMIRIPNNAYK